MEIAVACDVTNPLCGPQGASAVYGPQKGATPEMVARLDANLDHFAKIVLRDLGLDLRDLPGAGAAGGLGAGLVAFARGRLQGGVDLVIEAVKLRERLQGAELCLTGEGRWTARAPTARRPSAWPGWRTRWAVPPSRSPARSGRAPRPSWNRESPPTSASVPGQSLLPRRWRGRTSCSRRRQRRRCEPFSPVDQPTRTGDLKVTPRDQTGARHPF